MIMYNTLMGVAAGIALVLVPRLWARIAGENPPALWLGRRPVSPAGWAATFGVLGIVLTVLGGMMTLTWPLAEAKPYINIPFGEPSFLLGVLLLAAALFLGRAATGGSLDVERLRDVLVPVSRIVFWLGIVLVVCTIAIVRFDIVSSAPTEEPLSGLLNAHPIVENLFFALVMYAPAALGCLLFPRAIEGNRTAWLMLYWCWTIAGLAFAAFSALNYYTHTGMLMNLKNDGPDFRW